MANILTYKKTGRVWGQELVTCLPKCKGTTIVHLITSTRRVSYWGAHLREQHWER